MRLHLFRCRSQLFCQAVRLRFSPRENLLLRPECETLTPLNDPLISMMFSPAEDLAHESHATALWPCPLLSRSRLSVQNSANLHISQSLLVKLGEQRVPHRHYHTLASLTFFHFACLCLLDSQGSP